MSSTVAPTSPEPSRDRASVFLLLFAVFAPAVVWAGAHIVDYSAVSYRCYPRDVPRAGALPFGDWASILSLVVIGVAILVTLAALITSSGLYWGAQENNGAAEYPIGRQGRTKFLALCGVMTGMGALFAIGFDLIALFVVPLCLV